MPRPGPRTAIAGRAGKICARSPMRDCKARSQCGSRGRRQEGEHVASSLAPAAAHPGGDRDAVTHAGAPAANSGFPPGYFSASLGHRRSPISLETRATSLSSPTDHHAQLGLRWTRRVRASSPPQDRVERALVELVEESPAPPASFGSLCMLPARAGPGHHIYARVFRRCADRSAPGQPPLLPRSRRAERHRAAAARAAPAAFAAITFFFRRSRARPAARSARWWSFAMPARPTAQPSSASAAAWPASRERGMVWELDHTAIVATTKSVTPYADADFAIAAVTSSPSRRLGVPRAPAPHRGHAAPRSPAQLAPPPPHWAHPALETVCSYHRLRPDRHRILPPWSWPKNALRRGVRQSDPGADPPDSATARAENRRGPEKYGFESGK